MEIILLRQGRPEFNISGKARAGELPNIVARYNESGIVDSPPEDAKELALRCSAVICSDLPRSLHSANALGFREITMSNPMFREVAIPHFNRGSISLPLNVWATILRTMSVFGYSANGESLSMAKNRANIAATNLIEVAHQHNRIMLVGHGFINYFIAKELLSNKWIGPSKPGKDYWSYDVYRHGAQALEWIART